VQKLWRIAAMVLSDAAHHEKWKFGRAFEVFVLCPLQLLTHPLLQRKVLTVGRLEDFRGMTAEQPRFLFKYLNNRYLTRGLALDERAHCFIRHYHFMQAKVGSGFLQTLQGPGEVLHRHVVEDRHYEIVLRQAFEYFNEGEWSLCLLRDGEVLYISSFTIVPGTVLRIDAENAVLITRQQGAPRMFEVIAKATKDFMDVSPQYILFSALQGIALALGLRYIGCISGSRHISNPQPGSQLFRRPYDDFMVSLGAVGTGRGFYILQIPLREKPLKYLKRAHRTRTVRKRRFRSQIANEGRKLVSRNLRAVPSVDGLRKGA